MDRGSNGPRLATAGAAGLLFGMGLCISEMINPARVVGFLDVSGRWDPTLALVMIGALMVTIPGFRLALRAPAPLFAEAFSLPTRQDIDRRLVGGGLLFGCGWGLAGFCPGPALTALVSGQPQVFLFVTSLLAGTWAHDHLARSRQAP